MTSIFQPKQTKSHWTNAYNKSKTMRPHNILPVPIHAFRTASRLFLLPNLVIIPITTRCLFFAWAPSFSVKSFEVKPSCLAAANSVSRADNFFCCSLNKPSPHSIKPQNRQKIYHISNQTINQITCRLLFSMYHPLILQIGPKMRKSILLYINFKHNTPRSLLCNQNPI